MFPSHDPYGNASNNYGEALNLAVGGPNGSGGSNGLQIPAGSVIHVFWNLNIWRFSPDTDIAGESVTIEENTLVDLYRVWRQIRMV